jgi:cyclohexanone monooxygenase
MRCAPTQTPGEIDIPALKEKYRVEREKRMGAGGQAQYVRPKRGETGDPEVDPYRPVEPRAPITKETDAVIIGGGFTGILAAVSLRKAGISDFHVLDHAGDFGGVWYWNRYPGIQCDNESYCYMPLLEETGYIPSKRFADGIEIQGHCVRIAKHFKLYDHALFHTQVRSLRWDDSIKRWRVLTNRGDELLSRFVTLAAGPLNSPKLPGIPGLAGFKGKIFHSARWDYEVTGGGWGNPVLDKLGDKRVAVIGTGASAIQIVPHVAKHAKQVYVLQRTPPSVDSRPNPPTDPDWVKTLQPGWQKARQEHFHRGALEGFMPGEQDQVCDFWTEINRNVAAKLAAQGWPQITPEKFMEMREVEDYHVMERFRRRIDEIVEDTATADALKPWFRFHCKRPLSSDTYYPAFNQPNVRLLDVSDTKGVERLTEHGFIHQGREYPVDLVICASGFEVTSDLNLRWGIDEIAGREGLSLYDYWDEGYKSLHGIVARGFPNLFYTGYIQGGLFATTVEQFNRQGQHIAWLIRESLARDIHALEPAQAAQDAWCEIMKPCREFTQYLQSECPPSYLNNESGKFRYYLGEFYLAGFAAFDKLLADWREKGDFEGMELCTGGSGKMSAVAGGTP